VSETIVTAASAATTTTKPTHKKCPYCHGNLKTTGKCGMCLAQRYVVICGECGGAGTDVRAASVGVVAKCVICLGWGCKLPPKLYQKFLKREGGPQRAAVGSGVSGGRGLSTSLPNPPREIRRKAGRDRERLESEGA
jgi:hypothetical protein